MAKENFISEDLLNMIQSELSQGNYWLAYNKLSCYYEKGDMDLFKEKEEAFEFAADNISDCDSFKVIYVQSISDVRRQIFNEGESLTKLLENLSSIDLHPDEKAFADTLTDRMESQQLLNTVKTNFMNQKSFDYLKDQIKFTGFGDGLENGLKERLQKQSPEFQIYHNTKFGNDMAVATLHFRKSEQSDMYFFNKYNLTLKQENSPDMMEQTFYINKENNITLKEAYNLMSGRAINKDLTNKEGQVYNAWMQMDFKQTDNSGNYKMRQFHQNYGYDLESALSKHPIKELTNEQDKTRLVESLHKGNRQSVTFNQGGTEQKQFIEANPQFKTINIYDSNMQRISHKQGQEEKHGQVEQKGEKQTAKNASQKQGDADDSDAVPKVSNERTKKQRQSLS